MTEARRTYTRSSTAWPSHIWRGDDRLLTEQVQVDGSDFGGFDFGFYWYQFDHKRPPAVQLKAFDDSWHAIVALDLMRLLQELGQDATPAQLVSMLETRLGFTPSEYDGQLVAEKGPRT